MENYSEILEVTYTNKDNDIYGLSKDKPVLLFFKRHFGCMFCRQTMVDLSKSRAMIENLGVQIVFVHMSQEEVAEDYFEQYNLKGIEHVSDPDMSLYHLFGLNKGTFMELYNLNIMIKGAFVAAKYGANIKRSLGDFRQMPGIFLIEKGEVTKRFKFKNVTVKIEYERIIKSIQQVGVDDNIDVFLR